MAIQVSYPGVYIEEFTPGAPIEGVGTSTAAFLGPSVSGPLNEPMKITNWDQFIQEFGEQPLPGFYLWYAVRGFFENGGTVCYITRVSNATHAEWDLKDHAAGAGENTILLRARKPGILSPALTVSVDPDVHSVDASIAKLFRPTATIANASGVVIRTTDPADAAKFRPGDIVTWNGSTETDPVEIVRVEGPVLLVAKALSGTYSSGNLRLADLPVGATVFRVENAAKLSAGSSIQLEQGTGSNPKRSPGIVKRVEVERITPALTTYRVELRTGLDKTFSMTQDTSVESYEFNLTVTPTGGTPKDYEELGMDPEHVNYFVRVIQADETRLVDAEPFEPPNVTTPPDNRPRQVTAVGPDRAGTNENLGALAASDYKQALRALEAVDDVNLVAIPDRTDADVQLAIIAHCENMKDRFALLDSRRGANLFGTDSVEIQRRGLDTARGFAALYYPWVLVAPVVGSRNILVPPSGHIAGICARIDNTRGVHKAPAGTEALVNGVLGVERTMSDIDQGQLNRIGINVIRIFRIGGRAIVWGARTTATDTNWQYVNIRRLFLFLEESIEEGIRGAVFEPNNLQLWQKLKRTITEFLTRVWRDGALFGETADQAFYVRIDEALNPDTSRALGRLYIEIGVRPSYPAEFIIVRIGIWQGGTEVNES